MLLLPPASSLVKVTQALPLTAVLMAWLLVPSEPWPFSSGCLLVCLQYSMRALTTSACSSLLPTAVCSPMLPFDFVNSGRSHSPSSLPDLFYA